jgi:hypothetical protein
MTWDEKKEKAYKLIAAKYKWKCRNASPILNCTQCGDERHRFIELGTRPWVDHKLVKDLKERYAMKQRKDLIPSAKLSETKGMLKTEIWACEKCNTQRVWGSR